SGECACRIAVGAILGLRAGDAFDVGGSDCSCCSRWRRGSRLRGRLWSRSRRRSLCASHAEAGRPRENERKNVFCHMSSPPSALPDGVLLISGIDDSQNPAKTECDAGKHQNQPYAGRRGETDTGCGKDKSQKRNKQTDERHLSPLMSKVK